MSIDELLIVAVKRILQHGEDCTFERLVCECFTLFPKEFGLLRYPHWPDSARVNKAWLRCRTDRGWIVGNVKEGFRLTVMGEKVAEQAEQGSAGSRTHVATNDGKAARERFESILRSIKQSPLFTRYSQHPNSFAPNEMELREMLGCTLESPHRVLKQNFLAFKNAAMAYHDQQCLDFLTTCQRHLNALLRQT